MSECVSEIIGQIVVGIVSGIIASAIVSGGFYLLSGKDLVHAERRLSKLLSLLAKKLENPEAKLRFNEAGEPVGVDYVFTFEPAEMRAIFGEVKFTVRDKDGQIKEEK